MTQTAPETASTAQRAGSSSQGAQPAPRARFDELSIFIRRSSPNGVRMEIKPAGVVTAATAHVLPLFEGWVPNAELVVRAVGVCEGPFAVALEAAGSIVGNAAQAAITEGSPRASFSFELAVPLRAVTQHAGAEITVGVVVQPPGRKVALLDLTLTPIAGHGPHIASLDLLESTDSVLFDAPERRLFDLQNPEEGLWIGTGKWRLRLFADWGKGDGEGYSLDARPAQIFHRWQRAGDSTDVVYEDATRRAGGRRTYAELILDSSHPDIGAIPQEGKDLPLDLTVEHPLTFGGSSAGGPASTASGAASSASAGGAASSASAGGAASSASASGAASGAITCVCAWHAALPIRLRDPVPLLKTFQRLSAVGIDFGTTATVAALYHKGYRSLMRLGSSSSKDTKSAENPTYLLVEDHERLWAEMDRPAQTSRFPNLLRVIRGSHAAYDAMAESPNAVLGELKSLPERVINLDQSPQLRDRERQRDFLLDEARVRVLVRAYAYLLGRSINRPGQDVYLHYWLTHPAKFDERARKLLEEEIRNGILLSIPQGIAAEEITVEMSASEPEAFAAEVCPELAAHPALEPLISKFGEMRFAVFDFGGGTLDVACGRFRPATEAEQQERGSVTVIETLQVSGDDHLGGDYLTHELVWLTHQYEKHLPEMEEKEVPMMRPQTIPPNNLANKPHLYKRSLAGRQNRVRFDRELGLEAVKFGPSHEPKRVEELVAARLDGSEVRLGTLKSDIPGLHAKLAEHLAARIRDGVKLMKSMLRVTPWGGEGDWREQGVVVLLAGNSSRSEFVERALAEELGIPDLKVWRPDGATPFQQVVRYETPARVDRGANIVGVTPKTAVALGALKIANHEVHLVRRTQGFSYFMGDLRGFPPKFTAIIPMGAQAADPSVFGPHYIEFGRWDSKMPLRVAREYEAGKMTSNDPRISMIPTGLPAGAVGRLFVCVVTPDEVALCLQREGQEPLVSTVNLAKFMR